MEGRAYTQSSAAVRALWLCVLLMPAGQQAAACDACWADCCLLSRGVLGLGLGHQVPGVCKEGWQQWVAGSCGKPGHRVLEISTAMGSARGGP
jgi:hypothetical protein